MSPTPFGLVAICAAVALASSVLSPTAQAGKKVGLRGSNRGGQAAGTGWAQMEPW